MTLLRGVLRFGIAPALTVVVGPGQAALSVALARLRDQDTGDRMLPAYGRFVTDRATACEIGDGEMRFRSRSLPLNHSPAMFKKCARLCDVMMLS